MVSFGLTTREAVKAQLAANDASASNPKQDAIIDALIPSVSDQIESWLGLPIELISRQEVYSPGNPVCIRLHSWGISRQPRPVITEVLQRSSVTVAWDDATALTEGTHFYLPESRSGIGELRRITTDASGLSSPTLSSGAYWPCGPDTVRVTYTAGFAANQAALISGFAEIHHAASRQVAVEYRRRQRPQKVSGGSRGRSISLPEDLDMTRDVIEKLAPFRRVR